MHPMHLTHLTHLMHLMHPMHLTQPMHRAPGSTCTRRTRRT
jgi:hypothetical protein